METEAGREEVRLQYYRTIVQSFVYMSVRSYVCQIVGILPSIPLNKSVDTKPCFCPHLGVWFQKVAWFRYLPIVLGGESLG